MESNHHCAALITTNLIVRFSLVSPPLSGYHHPSTRDDNPQESPLRPGGGFPFVLACYANR
jgi:hypothetical protein